MDNAAIADVLDKIAALLELKGDNRFKVQAYARAARTIDHCPESIERLADEGRLAELPGIGEALTAKIHELLDTGRLSYFDELAAEFPPVFLHCSVTGGDVKSGDAAQSRGPWFDAAYPTGQDL